MRQSVFHIALMLISTAICFGQVANANTSVLTNGSFENDMQGWIEQGPGPIVNVNISPWFGCSAQDGAKQIVFNHTQLPTGHQIYQDFPTQPGATYDVGFNVGTTGGIDGMKLDASILSVPDAALLASHVGIAPISPGYGSQEKFQFLATTTTTRLMFQDTSVQTINVDVLLDNVTVTAVPEASVMSLAFAAIYVLAHRGRQWNVSCSRSQC